MLLRYSKPFSKRVDDSSTTTRSCIEASTKKRFKQILWMASNGSLGKRNIAIIRMLFGSGIRINEVVKLKVYDLLRETNELRTTFSFLRPIPKQLNLMQLTYLQNLT